MGDVPEARISVEDEHNSLLLNAIGEYEKLTRKQLFGTRLSWKFLSYHDL